MCCCHTAVMELTEIASVNVAIPVCGVLLCAVLVFIFGFKSPAQPPTFDFENESKQNQRKGKKAKVLLLFKQTIWISRIVSVCINTFVVAPTLSLRQSYFCNKDRKRLHPNRSTTDMIVSVRHSRCRRSASNTIWTSLPSS